MTDKLEGKELVTKVKQLIKEGVGYSQCAIQTGYASNGPNGNPIPASAVFSRALLEAAGFQFPSTGRGGVSGETVKANKNGTTVLSPSRVKASGIQPGDLCSIEWKEDEKTFIIKKKESVKKDDW